jgi:hypothetical protein
VGRTAVKAIAWILMGVSLITTYAEWRRGLVAIGVPDWLSWVISIPGALLVGILFLGFSGALAAAKDSETLWGGLLWVGGCLLVMVALGGFYIWVCTEGGGVDVTFP